MPELTSLQRYYRRKARWVFSGWCGYLPTFSATLGMVQRRFPVSAAGREFEQWAKVMYQREQEEALLVEGRHGPEQTLGRVPAHPVPDATRTTPHSCPLCSVGCSDAAGLGSCNSEVVGADDIRSPSDSQSEGLAPTESE